MVDHGCLTMVDDGKSMVIHGHLTITFAWVYASIAKLTLRDLVDKKAKLTRSQIYLTWAELTRDGV